MATLLPLPDWMYDKSMNEVHDINALTDKQIQDEIIWWSINLRRIPENQLDSCEAAPNAPDYLDRKPRYHRCAPRIYWAALEVARERGII